LWLPAIFADRSALRRGPPFVIEFRSVDGAHVTHNASRRRSTTKLIYAGPTSAVVWYGAERSLDADWPRRCS